MSEKSQEINRAQVEILYAQVVSPILTSLMAGLFLAFILWNVADHATLLVCLSLVTAIAFGRLLLTLAYRRKAPSVYHQCLWCRYFIIGLLLQGAMWGVLPILLVPEGATLYQVIIVLWLVGLTGAVSSLYNVHTQAVMAFVIPAIFPVIIYFFIIADTIHFFLAISLLVYMIVIISAMFQANKAITKGITLNIDLKNEIKERELSEVRYARIFNLIAEGLMYHLDGIVIDVNPSFLKIFGYTEEEKSLLVGKPVVSLLMEESKENIQALLNLARESPRRESGPFESVIKTKSGIQVIVEGMVKPDPYDRRNVRLVSIRDITDRKRIEARLIEMSLKDGLTGLSNRRHFDEMVITEWNRATRDAGEISLIMIDIDYFKLFNDSYGHQAGDGCLISVGNAIVKQVKRPADFVARYGGEELAVVLPNCGSKTATIIAESMREEVMKLRIAHAGSKVNDHVTISLGVATVIPERGSLPSILIKKADEALYEAKDEGRNMVVGGG